MDLRKVCYTLQKALDLQATSFKQPQPKAIVALLEGPKHLMLPLPHWLFNCSQGANPPVSPKQVPVKPVGVVLRRPFQDHFEA